MAKNTGQNQRSSHSLRHRVICTNDTFKGPWRTDIEDCYVDAQQHREVQGNELHIIKIVTEQTIE